MKKLALGILAVGLFANSGFASISLITTRDLRNVGLMKSGESFFTETLASIYFAIAFIPF